jgi:membrane-associated phospholipid phosphatase
MTTLPVYRRNAGRAAAAPLARYPLVGIALSAIATFVFAILTVNVLTNGPLIQGDQAFIQALHQQAQAGPAYMVTLMKIGSSIGFYGIMALLVGFAIYWLVRREWREFSMLLLGAAGGQGLFDLIAALINRPRPHFTAPYEGLTNFSFPSGHTVSSVLLFGLLIYIFAPRIRSTAGRVALILLGLVVVVWISYSRLYLGSHYLTDVIGGAAMGIGWGALVYTALDVYWQRRRERQHNA